MTNIKNIENISYNLKKIKKSTEIPTYSDILMCLDLKINHNLSQKDEELIVCIFQRASILCNDYSKKNIHKIVRHKYHIW